jgi:hypothetical protein
MNIVTKRFRFPHCLGVSQTQALRAPLMPSGSPCLKPHESPLAGDVLIVAAEQVALLVDDHGAATREHDVEPRSSRHLSLHRGHPGQGKSQRHEADSAGSIPWQRVSHSHLVTRLLFQPRAIRLHDVVAKEPLLERREVRPSNVSNEAVPCKTQCGPMHGRNLQSNLNDISVRSFVLNGAPIQSMN